MSLDLETALRTFLASAPQTIRAIATIQISHSAMTQTYYLWRETEDGEVTLEDDSIVTMQPANIEIKLAGSQNNLDQTFSITLGLVDIEDQFRDELDLIPIDTDEKIEIIYREYLSDDLTSIQAQTTLQAEGVTYAFGAASISAVSRRLNITRTGERYTIKTVPMLRGFL